MGILKYFSLEYFKSEKQKELEALRVQEQKIKNEILQKELSHIKAWEPSSEDPGYYSTNNIVIRPYKNIKLVNDVLTIVLNDGNILSKPGATKEEFQKAREANNEYELLELVVSKEQLNEKLEKEKEAARNWSIIKGIEELKDLEDFVIKDNEVYLKGINRTLPPLLVERFIELQCAYESDEHFTESDEYQSLKKFWLKCCLNPNAQSAEDLYEFLSNHQFKIDKHGNFYAYRRVVSREDPNKEMVEFVSNSYNKIKAIWKKKPIDYFVQKDEDTGEYRFSRSSCTEYNDLGNLQDLYLNLPNLQEKMYTSAHTGKEDYKVGDIISMPRNDGDDNNSINCSKGFHAASKAYNYSGFGDTPILVIINPIDVLAVPRNEVGKLRTCRWFFAMTLPEDEQYILDEEEFDVSELGDIFEEKCSENLQEHVKNGFAEEVKRHTFTLPPITGEEINTIITSLEDMKKSISERVVQFD